MLRVIRQAYDASKKLITALTPNRTDPKLTTAEITAAGFLSAFPTTLVAAPVERAKVILQVQGQGGAGEQKYKGVLDVVKGLYKEGGLRSIFRGSGATLVRDGPGSAMYVCKPSFLCCSGMLMVGLEVLRRLRGDKESLNACRAGSFPAKSGGDRIRWWYGGRRNVGDCYPCRCAFFCHFISQAHTKTIRWIYRLSNQGYRPLQRGCTAALSTVPEKPSPLTVRVHCSKGSGPLWVGYVQYALSFLTPSTG
jgi:hypothetical protein